MLTNRILVGSAAFGLSFGLSFLAQRNLSQALATGLVAPTAYAGALALDDRQNKRTKPQLGGTRELQELETRRKSLYETLLSAAAAKQETEANLSSLQAELDQIKVQVTEYQQRERQLEQITATLEERQRQKEDTVQELQAQIQGLTAQAKNLQQSILQATQNRQELENNVRNLRIEAEQLELQVTQYVDQKANLHQELTALQKTQGLLELEISSLQKQITTLENHKNDIDQSLSTAIADSLQPLENRTQDLLAILATQGSQLESNLTQLLAKIEDFLNPKNEWNNFVQEISEDQRSALTAIVRRDAAGFRKVADQIPTMPQVLIEQINSRALDTIGDFILQSDPLSVLPEISSEYLVTLERAIGRFYINNPPSQPPIYPVNGRISWQCTHTLLVSANSVAISPDAKTLVSGNSDGTIKLWNLDSGQLRQTLASPKNPGAVYSVAIDPAGKFVASGGTNSHIYLWDLATGELIHQLSGHATAVNTVCISASGKFLASGSTDRSIKIWNIQNGRLEYTLQSQSFVTSVIFNPSSDKPLLASGDQDGTIRLWSTKTRAQLNYLTLHKGKICSMAFSPSGDSLVSGASDGMIHIWNFDHQDISSSLVHHRGSVLSVAISPDGKTLISSGDDKTVKLWDLDSQAKEPRHIFEHSAKVCAVAFGADSRTWVSSSSDHTVKIWRYS